ncbi:MAG: flagellar protein FlaG [Acetobacterales bacterium]
MDFTGRVGAATPTSPGTPRATAPGAAGAAPTQAVRSTGGPDQPPAGVKATDTGNTLQRLESAVTRTYRQEEGTPDAADKRVELHIDKASGLVFGRVVNEDTGEQLIEIPSKEMRALIARTRETLGPVLNENV